MGGVREEVEDFPLPRLVVFCREGHRIAECQVEELLNAELDNLVVGDRIGC